MTITFTLLGFFIYVIAVSQTTLRYLEEQAQITLFFKDDFTEQNILNLKNNLEKDKRISSTKMCQNQRRSRSLKRSTRTNDPFGVHYRGYFTSSLEVRSKSVSELPKLAGEFSSIDGEKKYAISKMLFRGSEICSTLFTSCGFVVVALFL
jgi:cell division protein FtsX